VADIYAAYPREFWPAAASSTRSMLDKLAAEGRLAVSGDEVRPA
jgi:hypothetical protein